MSLLPLGILSSSGAGGGAFELISTVFGNGSANNITFSSIPSTYKHLQLRITAQNATANTDLLLRFNGDTASNYSDHVLYGTGSTVISANIANGTSVGIGNSTSTASAAGGVILDILDAFDTAKYKTTRSLWGSQTNGAIGLWSGNWRSTSAVTSIDVRTASGTNFGTIARFSLYGVKGS